jgi:hypothetical protein
MIKDKKIDLLFSSEYAKKLVVNTLKTELDVHHNKIYIALKKAIDKYDPPIAQANTDSNKKISRRKQVILVKRDVPKKSFSVYNGS